MNVPAVRPLVGTLTIGQAPRPDVAPIIEAHLPAGTSCVHAGVLDGLTAAEVARDFGARAGGRLLVSRLLDGTPVQLDAERIDAGVRRGVARLEAQGCGVIILLCTGVFHDLRCERAWLVEPDRVIGRLVVALLDDRRLGVMVPAAAQAATEAEKWSGLPVPPVFAAASPYADDVQPVRDAASALCKAGADVIVLDCIGYTERHRAAAAEVAEVPVLLSNALVARVAGELVAAWPGPVASRGE